MLWPPPGSPPSSATCFALEPLIHSHFLENTALLCHSAGWLTAKPDVILCAHLQFALQAFRPSLLFGALLRRALGSRSITAKTCVGIIVCPVSRSRALHMPLHGPCSTTKSVQTSFVNGLVLTADTPHHIVSKLVRQYLNPCWFAYRGAIVLTAGIPHTCYVGLMLESFQVSSKVSMLCCAGAPSC